MSRFFESICVENGKAKLLDYHQQRVDYVFRQVYKEKKGFDLEKHIPELPKTGLFKLRISYDVEVKNVHLDPYAAKQISKIKLLKNDHISYRFKAEDRSELTAYLKQNLDLDDVVFVKNGLITDGSYSNIAFFDGKEWHSPKTPLLKGIKRAYLIDQEQLTLKDIKPADIKSYQKIAFINAMRGLSLAVDLNEMIISS